MSSLAGPIRARIDAPARIAGRVDVPSLGITLGLATLLAALAFYAQGGVALEQLTWAQIALLAGGAMLAAAALAASSAGPLHGRLAIGLFGLFGLLTALSIMWSLAPSDSWIEANRTFSYLAVFGGALALARLAPDRWPSVLHGVALAAIVVCGYALLTRVFPEALAENEIFARLREPFGYWNSVGLMAAVGIPPLLWLGARRSGHAPVNALAYPGIGLLIVCLMLSYSRGALLALLIGLAAWFVVVPLRLRGAVVLAVPLLVAGAVVAWAFAQEGLTQDRLPMVDRSDAGHELGLLLVVMTVVLGVGGLVIGFLNAYRAPSEATRRLAGQAVIGVLVLAILAGLIGVASAPGGLDGQVSKAWTRLTDPAARTPANTPNRLTATASVRARYWREAFKVHAQEPWLGAGAGAYATVRKRYRTSDIEVLHAHGWVPQTMADLGWVGLLVSLAALAAWMAAAAAAIGLRRRDRELPWDAERVGMASIATVALVFGVHSAVDWTWFVPANAVAGMVCAGWLLGRGPVRERLGAPPAEAARLRRDPLRLGLAAGVLVLAVALAWNTFQPLRAVHAGDAAVQRMQDNSYDAAADIARIGADRNPLSVEPLWELATIEAIRKRPAEAEEALERAVALQPANPETWRRLGRFRLGNGLVQPALEPLRAAYYLDPHSPDSVSDLIQVSRLAAAP